MIFLAFFYFRLSVNITFKLWNDTKTVRFENLFYSLLAFRVFFQMIKISVYVKIKVFNTNTNFVLIFTVCPSLANSQNQV